MAILQADDDNFQSEVLQAPGAVLVDFSAAWCGPCKRLEPLIHEIAGEYEGRAKVVQVDVDRAPATAARFGVLSVPTLLFFRDGSVADQVVGLVPKRAIVDRLERLAAQPRRG